nr:MFS transporter [Bradyrhizobium sp. Leo121]
MMDGYDSVIIGITAPSIANTLGLDIKTFGPVFSAAQFGFMAGALFAGPIADRWGRKGTLVVSALIFGGFTLLTISSSTFSELVVYRFVTGLGLGGAATCFVSLSSEYAPKRVRGTVVAILWTLVPAGNVVGGILASFIIPKMGWTSVYIVGGVLPILFGLLILALVPESVSFLVGRNAPDSQIGKILARLSPGTNTEAARFVTSEEKISGVPFTHLFNSKYLASTLCIWVAFFSTWLILITTLAWTAPLVQQAGLSVSEASLIIACNSTGGVLGALIIGRLIDLVDRYLINVGALLLGALAVGAFGMVAASFFGFASLAFAIGFFVGGAASGITALAAISYPTALRSTGVGWAIAVARLGAATGPLVAGAIISGGGGRLDVFGTMAACGVVAAGAIFALRSVDARTPRLVQV